MVTIGQRLFRLVNFIAIATTLVASTRGELPGVLDRIPPGADTIVAIASLARFDENTSDLITSLEMNTISTFSQALSALGLLEGLDMQGSAAGVIYPAAEGVDSKSARYVLLIPLSSYDVFTKNMRAQRVDGLDRFEYAQMSFFSRSIAAGEFAVISEHSELVQSFTDQGGHMASHQRAIGARGIQVAEAADIIAIAGVELIRPMIVELLGPLFQSATGLPIPGMEDEDKSQRSLAGALLDRVEREGQTATIALSASPLGLKIDIAVRFRDGSEIATLSQEVAPRGENLLATLPNDPALIVGSVNLAHPGLRTLIADALDNLDVEPSADMDLASQLSLATIRSIYEMNSASIAFYSPPALFNGLLSRTAIVWQGDDPASVTGNFQRRLDAAGQREALVTSYSPGDQQIEGDSIDAWTIIPTKSAPLPDPLFGTGGIKGFISINDERGVMVWNQDEAFAASVLDPAEPLTQDLMLSQVGDLLPSDRIIECYLNPGPILTLTAPLLSMLAGGQQLDVPEMLPPIGASASLAGGALHTSVFIPAPLIRLVFDMRELVGLGAQQP